MKPYSFLVALCGGKEVDMTKYLDRCMEEITRIEGMIVSRPKTQYMAFEPNYHGNREPIKIGEELESVVHFKY